MGLDYEKFEVPKCYKGVIERCAWSKNMDDDSLDCFYVFKCIYLMC